VGLVESHAGTTVQRKHYQVASSSLDAVHRAVNFILLVVVVFWLAYFASQFAHWTFVTHSWAAGILHRFGDPSVARLTGIAGLPKLWVSLILAGIFYGVMLLADHGLALAQRALWSRAPVPTLAPSAQTTPASGEALEELYRQYRQIEKSLKEAERKYCTFLSIDVAGSSTMKLHESDIDITASFRAYEDLLRQAFLATRAWKQAWTPDGVMACYLNREQAVLAAKTILTRLADFNAHENQLKTPFQIRCGANEGLVVVFEDTNIEKLVDQVVDVAGHMQKHANPDTLRVSAELCQALDDSSGFTPLDETVDSYATLEWSPRTADAHKTAPSA